jgi:serine/threonine protein kinase/tetratricopeptide (TPR) repeat protein
VTDEERAADIAADCLDRRERGETIDTDEVLRAHPDFAVPLRSAFAALRRLDEEYAGTRPAPSRVGRTLGAYRLDAELGAGGMGTVYLATLERHDGDGPQERVAVKVLHPHLLVRPDSVRRLLREAEIGRRVRHENVVRTLDAAQATGGDERLHYVVMEYVEGRTLRALADDLGRVPEELCRHIGREVAKGLVAIHAAGAIHRDLKPENVIISRCAAPGHDHVAERLGAQPRESDGHVHHLCEHVVKVMDLGVARLVDESLRVSQTGAFVGSIRYAAPEQFGFGRAAGADEAAPRSPVRAEGGRSTNDVDGRADLYSLGLTLYELATGTHPFAGDDFHVVFKRQLSETPRPAGEVNPQLSPFFEDLLARLVEKDRDRRIASAAELVRILDEGEESAWWRERSAAIREATHRPLRRIRVPRETALFGREAELTLLRSLYERASEGEGQVALVEGEAGIGKSRLVDEFVGQLAQAGEDVNFLYGSYPPGGAATASGAFTSAYREHLGDDEASIRAALPYTPLLVPAFAALLRGDAAPSGAEPLTKDSLQTAFVHATRSFAGERPTIVLIDDLHFAPEEGRALFASLALAVPGHRILLVGCARPRLDEKWVAQLAARPQTTRLALPRLGAKELVRLLRDVLKSERLAEELSALIALKSDGNPFFVFELLRGLRDGQFLRQKPDGTWETTQIIRDIQVPSSITELVQARVADLDAEDKNLLDVAACCGFEFDPLIVAAALGVGQIPAMQRLARIERRHRLVRSAGRRFVFDHHQVQEALYGGMPELLREPYHAAIAEAIEARSGARAKEPKDVDGAVCVDLAEHLFQGAQGERAVRYLDAALDHLEKGYLNDAAVRLADRALAVPGLVAGRTRCELLLRKADRFEILGRRDEQRAAIEKANALADADGDRALRARALCALGDLHVKLSRHDEAQAVLGEVLATARAAGDRKAEAAATGVLGTVFILLGRLGEAQEHLDRLLALSKEIGDRQGEAKATANQGTVLFSLGRLGEAREHFERHLALARAIGDRRGEAVATGNLGSAFVGLGRLGEAREHFERFLALSRAIGDRQCEAIATGNLGSVSLRLGRLEEARPHHERNLAISREIGDRRGEATATVSLGEVLFLLGRLGQAREQYERYLQASREIGDPWHEGFGLQALADVAAEEGDADAAERGYADALALRRKIGHRDGEAETLVVRGAYLARQGRAAEGRADLGAALAIARELSLPGCELLATAQLATLPGGPARDPWTGAVRARPVDEHAGPQDGLVPWSRALRDRPADDPARPADMVAAALAALAAHEGHAEMQEAMQARFLLWQATRDPAHLVEAKRLLDFLVEHAPPDCRESMLANVRLHRDIAAAAREEGLPLAADSSRAGDERSAGSADA